MPPCLLSLWQVEAENLEVQGHLQVHSEFKISLGYMRPFLKQTNKQTAKDPDSSTPT